MSTSPAGKDRAATAAPTAADTPSGAAGPGWVDKLVQWLRYAAPPGRVVPPPSEPEHDHYLGLGIQGFHDLHYLAWPSRGSGRPTVCVHGLTRNAHDFDPLARQLSQHAPIFCPDLAGRGASAWLPNALDYHFPQYLADLNGMLNRAALREVNWLGTSLGGLLGILLAGMPGSPIRRLVLNDVGAELPGGALTTIARHVSNDTRFETVAQAQEHLSTLHADFGDDLTQADWAEFARHSVHELPDGGYRLAYDPSLAMPFKALLMAPPLLMWDAWDKIRCPVLIIRGERSNVISADTAQEMARRHPGAEVVEFAGCGHAPALRSAQQIAAVTRFLYG